MSGAAILALNAGSSSIKFALFERAGLERLAGGLVDGVGTAGCRLVWRGSEGEETHLLGERSYADHFAEIAALIADRMSGWTVAACSHRVVHGGGELDRPVEVSGGTMARLEALSHLAPLHQPHNLAGIRGLAVAFPGVPQIACFDTAFHRNHPRVAEVYALPREMTERGIRRYGFHGLSYDFIAGELRRSRPDLAAGRVIVAHLGSGASLCAMENGRSIETTMGFTALDGLPMSTRTGQIDPGVVFHLAREGMDLDRIEQAFYRDSGLKGLSGISGDMRRLLDSETDEAAFAVDYFCHRVAREIGGLAVALGGLDGLVFTAGIGEHQPPVRANVCARLGLFGIRIDGHANDDNAEVLSTPDSAVTVLRLPTDEELMLARYAAAFV